MQRSVFHPTKKGDSAFAGPPCEVSEKSAGSGCVVLGLVVRVQGYHYDAALGFYGDALGARIIRKHLGWYMDRAGTPAGLRKRVLTGAPDDVRRSLSEALLGHERVAA